MSILNGTLINSFEGPSTPSMNTPSGLQLFVDYINVLEGVKTKIKNLHWSAKKLPNSDKRGAHLYLDDFLDVVSDFQDTVAESSQGQYGVMDTNAVSGVPFQCSSPKELMNYVEERTAAFYISIPEGPISSGVKSETETFIKNVEKYKYLFDLTE